MRCALACSPTSTIRPGLRAVSERSESGRVSPKVGCRAVAVSPIRFERICSNEARLISFHNCYCGNSPHSPLTLPQLHARLAAVLGDELNARRLKGKADRCEVLMNRQTSPFESLNRA